MLNDVFQGPYSYLHPDLGDRADHPSGVRIGQHHLQGRGHEAAWTRGDIETNHWLLTNTIQKYIDENRDCCQAQLQLQYQLKLSIALIATLGSILDSQQS